MNRRPKKIMNPRILSIAGLGFFSGLPLALTSSTLQAWFTNAGISLMNIGVLSLIGLPYALKFIWSPVLDKVTPPFWGRRRGWMGISQIVLCITLFFLAHLNPSSHANLMAQVALFIAFLSASQDIAIDAYRTDILLPHERSLGSALFIFTARISLFVSGGLALILADHMGWKMTYQWMAVIMCLSVIVTYFSPNNDNIKPPNNFTDAVIEPSKDLLRRDSIFLILAFIVMYKIGDALALQLMSTFLLRGLGFSLTDVGIAYKTIGFIATILGTFVGASLIERLGLFRSLLFFGIGQAFTNLLFMLLAIVGKNYYVMITSLFVESFITGMASTALLVFVTSLCNQKYSATQFACLSALFSIGRIFLGPLAALMVFHLGWANFYASSVIVCLPAILLLVLMRTRINFNAEAII